MKKDTKLLLGLLAVLVLCGAGYLGLRAWNSGAEEREAQQAPTAADLEDVTALAWSHGGERLSFDKLDGVWVKTDDPEYPADQDKLEDIALALSPLKAVRAFSEPDEPSAYGLDEPSYTLTATEAGGGSLTLLLGDQYEGDYYAMAEGGGTVYTVASALAGQLDQGILDLIELPALPGADGETLTGVELEQGGTVLALSKGEAGWTVDGQPVPEENAALSGLVTALGSPRFTACWAYRPDEAAAAACGLDDAALLTVTAGSESYTLRLGSMDEESGDYYARLGDGETIYLVDASLAGTVLGLTQESLTEDPAAEG